MKKYYAVLLLAASSCAYSVAAQAYSCEHKLQALQTQLSHAKEYGNSHRQRGLERAIAQVKAHCSDTQLQRDLREEIEDYREDIDDILKEIHEKQVAGRLDKVERLQRKLERKRQKLADLQAVLANEK